MHLCNPSLPLSLPPHPKAVFFCHYRLICISGVLYKWNPTEIIFLFVCLRLIHVFVCINTLFLFIAKSGHCYHHCFVFIPSTNVIIIAITQIYWCVYQCLYLLFLARLYFLLSSTSYFLKVL